MKYLLFLTLIFSFQVQASSIEKLDLIGNTFSNFLRDSCNSKHISIQCTQRNKSDICTHIRMVEFTTHSQLGKSSDHIYSNVRDITALTDEISVKDSEDSLYKPMEYVLEDMVDDFHKNMDRIEYALFSAILGQAGASKTLQIILLPISIPMNIILAIMVKSEKSYRETQLNFRMWENTKILKGQFLLREKWNQDTFKSHVTKKMFVGREDYKLLKDVLLSSKGSTSL